MDAPAHTAEAMLEKAQAASFAWAPETESLFRSAVTAAREAGDPAQLTVAWIAVGNYLWERARTEPALLAYASARNLARQACDAEREQTALMGIVCSLSELGDEDGTLAAKLILGELGEESWAQLPHRLQRRLQKPESVLESSITAHSDVLPGFERRFLEGDLRFDRPESLLEIFSRRAKHYQTSLLATAFKWDRQAHERQFRRRLIWPAMPLLALAAGFALGWLPLGRWIYFALPPALVIYVAVWRRSVRNVHRKSKAFEDLVEAFGKASSTHDEAVRILERFAKDREPFALYLRSFEGEAFEALGVTSIGSSREKRIPLAASRRVLSTQGGPSKFERYLKEHVARLIPVVTLADPVQLGVMTSLPRLELENDAWHAAVRWLLGAAHFVVIEPARASPGVVQEIELIRYSDRLLDTIVVLPSAKTRSDMDVYRDTFNHYFEQPVGPTSEFSNFGDPALAEFPRVVDDEAFGERDPTELLVFHGLLPGEPAASPEEYGRRRRERFAALCEAISLYENGLSQLKGGEPAEAMAPLQQAAASFGDLAEPAFAARPLNALGMAWKSLGDLGEAASFLTAAAEIQRETGPPEQLLVSIQHLAPILLESGDREGARACFDEMLQASRRWSFAPGEAQALEGLGLCEFLEQDYESAAESFRQALRTSEEPGHRASAAKLLAMAQLKLGRHDEAADSLGISAESFEAFGDQDSAHSVLREQIMEIHNAAVVDLRNGAAASAVARLEKALSSCRELAATDLKPPVLFRLGLAYSRTGQDPSAIEAFRQSADLERRAGDDVHRAISLSNLGALLIRNGKTEEGIEVLTEAERSLRLHGEEDELAHAVYALGEGHFRLGQYAESLPWYEEALRLYRQQGCYHLADTVDERIQAATSM